MTQTPNMTATSGTPTSVLMLSTVLFAAFAFVVTIVALNIFWPAGFALAVILGWRGGFAPSSGSHMDTAALTETIKALSPEAERRTSGNTSFDAYRADTLDRLEQEQHKFEGFLDRLRAAKDKGEFDQFMDDRAARLTAQANGSA